MENMTSRISAVVVTAFPVAWIIYKLGLADHDLVKGLTTLEDYRAFCATRYTDSFWLPFVAILVFGLAYIVLNEFVAAGIRALTQKLFKEK